ncbi:hypothetical protein AB0M46_50745 [Dactylosporangium sp. NPDC051485]|uniref:hypothetical protein n=1 Tax=Dactylosporangium sp. NPDC051485 TaxID=3154846 RepID=UPI0034399E8B
MRQLVLNIAPEVAELLGSEDAILAAFDAAELGFVCTACGQPGTLTATDRASVVAYLPDHGRGAPVVRYAHEHCQASELLTVDTPVGDDPGSVWPAQAWLRPDDDDPAAVVLIGPRLAALRVTDGGETIDRITAGLLGVGFELLDGLDGPMPNVEGLAVRLGLGDRVSVVDGDDCPLWDGPLVLPPGWTEAATTTGRVGVVVASGLNLLDVERDHLADLHDATGRGAAVAATAQLLTDD